MSEDIPEDYPTTFPDDIERKARAICLLINKVAQDESLSPEDAADVMAYAVATALHTERKKWDGASTFKRLMEK